MATGGAGRTPAVLWGLPEGPAATEPPEARGVSRDGVRLLVARGSRVRMARFRELPRFLRPGDLLVVNTSATLPAAVDGELGGRRRVTVHFSTIFGDGTVAVEVRPSGGGTGPVGDLERGETVALPEGAVLVLMEGYADARGRGTRLWRARLSGAGPGTLLRRHGRPIAYAYVEGRWPLDSYQTVFARHAGSAEMPSAARPFSHRLVTALVARGVGFTPVTLHAGVSSPEAGERPLAERFRVPPVTAARVNTARAAGCRVIAVGTTSARALESVATGSGAVVPGGGWTELVLSRERPVRVVDGLITGWHGPGASHVHLLESVAGEEMVRRAYAESLAGGLLWHEFGDSCLLLPRDTHH